MKKPTASTLLVAACLLGLAALLMMTWSLFDPRPIPVIAAMSVGQVLGTASFVTYLVVVVRDLRRGRAAAPSAGRDAGEQRVE
ncbi:MAG TPA: hypothetical protein VGG39_35940 [Polyangiaceae bacterium]|jgi:hypothetical protein